MKIKINLQIFIFAIIFYLTKQIRIYTILMIFAFIHELGHMVTGILLKLKPKSLNFMPFGISITFESYEYKRLIEIKKIIIACAGPLTNIIICVIASLLHIEDSTKEIIIYSNILIALFNLIPLYPLDGGRILKGIARLRYKEIKADEIINTISNIVIIILTAISSIMILYLKNISIIFILIYLWLMIIKENRKYNIKKRMYKILQKNKQCIDI